MAKVFSVANQKGGVGKTTTAICLAQELKDRGYKVLAIDSDHQCNLSDFYGASHGDGDATLVDIFCGDEPASECVQKTDRGHVIPADSLLFDAENMIKNDEMRFLHLRESLASVMKKYDYIIIDTPPTVGVCLKNVLACTDYVIVPVDESGWALKGLMSFSEALRLARLNNKKLKVAGVLTVKAKERTKKSARMGELATGLSKSLKTKCFETKIRETVACAEALSEYSVPLSEYAPKSNTYLDYKAFTDELLGVI